MATYAGPTGKMRLKSCLTCLGKGGLRCDISAVLMDRLMEHNEQAYNGAVQITCDLKNIIQSQDTGYLHPIYMRSLEMSKNILLGLKLGNVQLYNRLMRQCEERANESQEPSQEEMMLASALSASWNPLASARSTASRIERMPGTSRAESGGPTRRKHKRQVDHMEGMQDGYSEAFGGEE